MIESLGSILLRAVLLMLTAEVVPDVSIESFWEAVIASLIISIVYKVVAELIPKVIEVYGIKMLERKGLIVALDLVLMVVGTVTFMLVGGVLEGVDFGNIYLTIVSMLLYNNMVGVIERE